jgi:hypothetical protein
MRAFGAWHTFPSIYNNTAESPLIENRLSQNSAKEPQIPFHFSAYQIITSFDNLHVKMNRFASFDFIFIATFSFKSLFIEVLQGYSAPYSATSIYNTYILSIQ